MSWWNPRSWFSKGASVFAAVTPNSADIPENEAYWRRLGASSRNLPEHDQRRMQEDAVRSYQRHGLGRSAIRIKTGFVVGAVPTEPQVVCEDTELREAIDEHLMAVWEDPRNDMETRTRQWHDSLSVNGELFVTVHPDEGSRHTLFGFLDPCSVKSVICDPMDAQTPIAALRDDGMGKRYVHPIIGRTGMRHKWFIGSEVGQTATLPGYDFGGGDLEATIQPSCFYLGINNIPGQSRGISDLYPVLDQLDLLDRITYSSAERDENMSAFSWGFEADPTTSDKAVEEVLKTIAAQVASGSGEVVGYKGGTLRAIAPQLNSADWNGAIKRTRAAVLAGLIFPEAWFDAAATTFAAAGDGASPALTALQERQSLYRCWLEGLLEFAVRQLPAARRAIDEDRKAWRIELPLPVIVGKDTMRESAVLTSDLNALAMAVSEGFLTEDAAQRFAADALTAYGYTVRDGDQPEPGSKPTLEPLPFPAVAPTNQTMPNRPGEEGGRGEDEAHSEAA